MELLPDGRIKELSAPFMGSLAAMNPWIPFNSGPRLAMMTVHMPQALVVKGATRRRFFVGVETNYTKHTFNVEMPATAQLVRVIERLPNTITMGVMSGFKKSPEVMVIYEDLDVLKKTGVPELNCLVIPTHWCLHQSYGYEYIRNKRAWDALKIPGNIIDKKTEFCRPPDVSEDGNWLIGVDAKVCYLGVSAIIEDGYVVSDEWASKCTATGIGVRSCSWGGTKYALNLYGDENNYKPFPEPGDKIRDDGLLFALRPYGKFMGVCDMTPDALMTPEPVFDEMVFAEPGATVVDVKVMHDRSQRRPPTPSGMSDLCDKYLDAQVIYSRKIVETIETHRRKRGGCKVGDRLHRLAVVATDDIYTAQNQVSRTYRGVPLDDWTVEITYSYEQKLTVGSKITNFHGGKGIVVEIRPKADMPTDMFGVVADIIKDPHSVAKRMNDGCFYEQYLGASLDQMDTYLRELYRVAGVKKTHEVAMEYYACISSPMVRRMERLCVTDKDIEDHVMSIVKDGLCPYLPCGTPELGPPMVINLRNKFPVRKGPVRYRSLSGQMEYTKENVLIGSMYMMVLEKTGTDWSAVGSVRHQHHGVPAKLTQKDRTAGPWKEQSGRSLAEAEIRSANAAVDTMIVSDLAEMPNNPEMQRHIARKILTSPQPMNIDSVVDWSKTKRGYSRALLFVKHLLECMGIWFARNKD
jgi:hypothetical protein